MGLRDRMVNKLIPGGGISVDEALMLLSQGGVLVDVRSRGEFETAHAPGARLVDIKQLHADPFSAVYAGDPLAEPDASFVLICDTGLRSGYAVPAVREKGFRCEFVTGGLQAWRDSGQVLIPGPPRPH